MIITRRMFWAVSFCAVFSTMACGTKLYAQQRPSALEKMVEYRAALQTAKLELRKTFYEGLGSRNGAPRTVYEAVSIAGGRHLHTVRGDEQGVVIPVIGGGGPAPVSGRSPLYRLVFLTESWQRSDDALVANRFTHSARSSNDLRTLGIASAFVRGDIHDVVWDDNRAAPLVREYNESREGELHLIRARTTDYTRTYWLDPARGYSPVRVREEYPDGNWTESRSILQRADGVWFPASVHIFSSRHRDGREPTMVVEVDSAEFNRPEHPLTLTLADIGVDAGMGVFDHTTKPATHGRWDGEKITTDQEYLRRIQAGEIQEGPKFKELFRRAANLDNNPAIGDPANSKTVASERRAAEGGEYKESEWETYVRNYITKYKLDNAQVQQANAILKSCTEKANKYLASRKAEIEKLDQRALLLRNPDAKDKVTESARITEERKQLRKPIDDIFENELKPRLEKLPTRKQRTDAENAAQGDKKPKSGG